MTAEQSRNAFGTVCYLVLVLGVTFIAVGSVVAVLIVMPLLILTGGDVSLHR